MESTKRNLILSFLGLCFLNLVASIDSVALAVSIPAIATALNLNSVQAYWTGTAFVLGSAVFQPVFAALSNAFGRKPIILTALTLFAVGTIVCGTSRNVESILIGRSIQGVGGGGLLTMTYVVMSDLLSLRDRAKGIAIISLVWLVGTSCGPILGGGFTSSVGWRWIFWIALPFTGIGFLLVALFPRTPHQHAHPAQAVKKFDWIGAALFVASLTSLLIAISWGGTMFAWRSYATLVPLVLGVLGLAFSFAYEIYIPSHPLFPLAILKDRTAAICFLGTFLMGIVQFAMLYYLPLYYQVSKGYSPLVSGIAIVPNCAGAGITTTITGVFITKSGHYKVVIWAGWALLSMGCGLLVLLSSSTSVPAWIFINLVSALGLGCLFSSLPVATQAPQSKEHMALASGLTPFFRAVGQAFGIAIGDSVYQNVLRMYLLDSSSPFLQQRATFLATNSVRAMSLILQSTQISSLERVQLLRAFNLSLHAIWWTMMGISLLAGVLSILVRHHSLTERKPTESQEKTFTGNGHTVNKTPPYTADHGLSRRGDDVELETMA